MAIEPTGAIYKTLTFDGESSGTYGVYITGEAVYNAPEREVEMISIPGRSGQLALDKGRFENIEVSYPAGIFADNEEDFAEGISNFRNFLCSRNGYVRLQDDYNPNEYRLAIYKSGLEVDNALHRAGEFDIVFDCKPQRYLTSGEDAIEVDSGDVITNPTLFESSPLIVVEGDGNLVINDYEITINGNEPIGMVQLADSFQLAGSRTVSFDTNLLNAGDDIYVADSTLNFEYKTYNSGVTIQGYSKTVNGYSGATVSDYAVDNKTVRGTVSYGQETFKLGTARDISITTTYTFTLSNGDVESWTRTFSFKYDGAGTITKGTTASWTGNDITGNTGGRYGAITGYSTILQGGTTILDCDIGEAYKYDDGTLIPLNELVSFGSDLPTLKPGANTITFDNTITDLKVTPRWWKI